MPNQQPTKKWIMTPDEVKSTMNLGVHGAYRSISNERKSRGGFRGMYRNPESNALEFFDGLGTIEPQVSLRGDSYVLTLKFKPVGKVSNWEQFGFGIRDAAKTDDIRTRKTGSEEGGYAFIEHEWPRKIFEDDYMSDVSTAVEAQHKLLASTLSKAVQTANRKRNYITLGARGRKSGLNQREKYVNGKKSIRNLCLTESEVLDTVGNAVRDSFRYFSEREWVTLLYTSDHDAMFDVNLKDDNLRYSIQRLHDADDYLLIVQMIPIEPITEYDSMMKELRQNVGKPTLSSSEIKLVTTKRGTERTRTIKGFNRIFHYPADLFREFSRAEISVDIRKDFEGTIDTMMRAYPSALGSL